MLRRIIGHIKGIKRKMMMFLFMHNFFYKIKCVPEKNWENSLSALQEFTDRFQIGPTIGTHIGPGAYGIIFVRKV